MKLYKTKGLNDQEGWSQKWDGTQADARATRKDFKERGLSKIETKEVDVPTDKPGLLAWLNANVTGE